WCGVKHFVDWYTAIGTCGHRCDRRTGDCFRHAPFHPEVRQSEGTASLLGCFGISGREDASTRRKGDGTRWSRASPLSGGVLLDLARWPGSPGLGRVDPSRRETNMD